MVDEAAATSLAQDLLKVPEAEVGLDLVLTGEPVEVPDGYLFGYQSRRFVEEGDLDHALAGNLPVFVDGLTGEASHCSAERYDELRRAEAEVRWRPLPDETAEAYVERVGGRNQAHLKMTEVLTEEFGLPAREAKQLALNPRSHKTRFPRDQLARPC